MKRGFVLLFLFLFLFGFVSSNTFHNASEVYINTSGTVYSLQEIYDNNLYYEYVYANPSSEFLVSKQYELASDVWISIDPSGESSLLDILNSGEKVSGGYFNYLSFEGRHSGNDIIFSDGRNLQQVILDDGFCVPNYNDVCGGSQCVNSGSIDCKGDCVGTSNKPIGASCATVGECDGLGVCDECPIESSYSCYGNDVYYYDACGDRGDKKQECGTDSCGDWSSPRCVHYDQIWEQEHDRTCYDRGCSGDSCYANKYTDTDRWVNPTCMPIAGDIVNVGESINDVVNDVIDSGSCPFVYSYDGENWNFEHEAFPFSVIKSAEGRTYDRLKYIEGVDGSYYLRIQENLTEVSFINDFKFYLVEHEKDGFVMPSLDGEIHVIQNLDRPVSCLDRDGNDCIEEVSGVDSLSYGDDFYSIDFDDKDTYQDWVVLEFEKPEDADVVKLFFNVKKQMVISDILTFYMSSIGGNYWNYWQSILEKDSLSNLFENLLDNAISLRVEVWNGEEWVNEGYIRSGLETLDDFLISVDISEIETEELKVRLISTKGFYEIFYAAADYSSDGKMDVSLVEPEYAIFNDERSVVSELKSQDDSYVSLNKGDYINLKYDLPVENSKNWNRDYYISIDGYYNYIGFEDQSFVGFTEGMSFWLKALFSPEDIPRVFALNRKNDF